MYDARSTSPALRDASVDTAVVTVGSTEQHGLHLPLSVDFTIGAALAPRVASALGAYCLPVLPFGTAREHTGSVGTISLAPKTLYDLLHDVAASLAATGFTKIAVVTPHGGNWILKPAVRELNQMGRRLQVALADPYRIAAASLREVCPTAPVELHGGEVETSIMLALDPDSVHMELAEDHVPDLGVENLDYLTVPELTPHGIWGRPTGATADKGHRALEVMARDVAAYCAAVFERMATGRREGEQA